LNIYLAGFLYVFFCIAMSLLGMFTVRRYVPSGKLRPHHDVAGFLIAIVGVIYAVLLAFVVVVVWEQFEGADQLCAQEATAVLSTYRLLYILPPTAQIAARQDLKNYTLSVVSDEWTTMEQGKESGKSQQYLDLTWEDILQNPPKSAAALSLYPNLVAQLNRATNDRLQRLVDSRSGLPPLMWAVLIFGAIATIGFTYFFSLENGVVQVVMTLILSMMIGLVLFLTSAINCPFSGELKVYPDAMQSAEGEMVLIKAVEKKEAAKVKASELKALVQQRRPPSQ
jgi:hypothetical protein